VSLVLLALAASARADTFAADRADDINAAPVGWIALGSSPGLAPLLKAHKGRDHSLCPFNA
jgi:hypothetical protein